MKDIEVYLYLHSINRSRATFTRSSSHINKFRIDTDDIVDLTPMADSPYQYIVRCLVRLPYNIAETHGLLPQTGKLNTRLSDGDLIRTAAQGSAFGDMLTDAIDREMGKKSAPSNPFEDMNEASSDPEPSINKSAIPPNAFHGLKAARARPLAEKLREEALNLEQTMLDESNIE